MTRSRPVDDPAFADWVEDAREGDLVALAEARGAKLRRVGQELVGPCPLCGGREDRLSIHPGRRVYLCRSGGGGDAIALVQHLDGCDFLAACEAINRRPPPGRDTTESPTERAAREARLVERQREAKARDADRGATEAHFREAERDRAYQIWQAGEPMAGSVAARYLAGRGITHLDGVRLRASPGETYWVWSAAQKASIRAGRFPAMLAGIVDAAGRFLAVHITYLDAETGLKAMILHPETGEKQPAKKIRGPQKGGVIRLAGPVDAGRLVMGEGIETTLSPREDGSLAGRDMVGIAWWAGVSLGNIGGGAAGTMPHPAGLTQADSAGRRRKVTVTTEWPKDDGSGIALPDTMRDVTLLADADGDTVAVELALRRAARRWQRETRVTRIAWADMGMDFNDMWMAWLGLRPAGRGAA